MGDKKKKKGRGRKRVTPEQISASRYVNRWVFGDSGSNLLDDDFVPANVQKSAIERVGFEFHSHSRCSDGFLSPSAVVERAHRNGVSLFVDCFVGFFCLEVRKLGFWRWVF